MTEVRSELVEIPYPSASYFIFGGILSFVGTLGCHFCSYLEVGLVRALIFWIGLSLGISGIWSLADPFCRLQLKPGKAERRLLDRALWRIAVIMACGFITILFSTW